jgi:hypothetical protein
LSPSAVTVFVVYERDNVTQNASVFGSQNPDDNNRWTFHAPFSDGYWKWDYGDAYYGTGRLEKLATGFTSGQFNIVRLSKTGTGTNQTAIYVNGALSAQGTTPGSFNMVTKGTWYIGSNIGGAALQGDISRILIFNRALTTAEITYIENGLSGFFQLPINGTISPVVTGNWATPEKERVTGIYLDGVALPSSQWTWDGTNVALNLNDAINPNAHFVEKELTYYFSSDPKNLDGHYWEPRLTDIPKLSLRVEKDFGQVAQIGSGTLSLSNADGFFNTLRANEWNFGRVYLSMGADTPTAIMPYSDYQPIGCWVIDSFNLAMDKFELALVEVKSRTQKKIPFITFDKVAYPRLADGEEGNPIPIIYGTNYGVRAIPIDIDAFRFKLCGHSIRAILDVRMSTDSGWQSVTVTDIDKTTSEFTVEGWDGSSSITVDMEGKTDSNGYLISNPADIIQDLLSYIGETDLDAVSFADARAYWDIGYIRPDTLNRVASINPSIYIGDLKDCFDVLGNICGLSGAYLYSDALGRFKLVAFRPKPGESLPRLTDADLLEWKESNEGETPSKYVLGYASRLNEDWKQSVTVEKTSNQYRDSQPVPVLEEKDVDLALTDEVTAWANERLYYNRRPTKSVTATVSNIGLTYAPGDQLLIQSDAFNVNDVFEVIAWEPQPDKGTVSLSLGDLHGVGDTAAFYVASSGCVFPTRLGGASCSTWATAWTNTQKTWARQNVGFYSDDKGFATTSPTSILDKSTSVYMR